MSLRVAVVEENAIRSAILVEGLRDGGMTVVAVIASTDGLLRHLLALDADAIVIGLENPCRNVLDQVFQVAGLVSRPVAMFVDRSDEGMIGAAVNAGVAAYVVDGLRRGRVKAIVETAVRRFTAVTGLQRDLDTARSELAARKVIERAKGILMRTRQMSEEDAYALLRQTAMNEKRKLADVAGTIVTAAALFEK